jgi:FtsH-binding integral membrane protein
MTISKKKRLIVGTTGMLIVAVGLGWARQSLGHGEFLSLLLIVVLVASVVEFFANKGPTPKTPS